MAPSVTVRERTDGDLDAVVRLAKAVHASDGYPGVTPSDWSAFLVSHDALGAWVAELDGRIVGHAALHRTSMPVVMELASERLGVGGDQLGAVARLFVDPALRRAGAGRMLLERTVAACWQLGRHPILDVVARFEPAVALYASSGWANAGEVELVFPNDESVRSFVFIAPDNACRS